ncbi:MAG TPA: tetratricopeptide repeat protein [Polyangiaceae bacterium]|nr:tetratricopeptide repeat protein [Polyangiaceae bacterium]
MAVTRTSSQVCLSFVLALGVASACRKREETPQHAAKPAPKPEETCDADGWCVQKPPPKALCAVWAASATDVWAAGNTVAHWDGVRWNEVKGMPAHEAPRGGCSLSAIHGVGPNAIWAVGEGLALFWDGKKLTQHPMPIPAADVFVTAIDDAWAVGTFGSVARWDGRQWTQLPRPTDLKLESVFCANKNDCWTAGYTGEVEPGDSSTFLHWDGTRWEEQRVSVPGVRALSGTASNDVWAVGTWGRIFHYDGRNWAPSPSPAQRTLYEVHAAARDDVWALGDDGLIIRFDGKQWSAAQPTWPRLTALSTTPSRELWTLNAGTILHWRGPTFRPKAVLSKDLWDLDPAETQRQKDRRMLEFYLKHLAEGRKATKAARYEAAVDAFAEALWAKPDDAQVYAERGYALYLARKLDDAERDLEQAADRATDRKLRAQIFFNLGLVREARAEDATSAFALSNFLNATAAAQKRLVGKNACALEIDRNPSAVEQKTYGDWLAFHTDVKQELFANDNPATSDEAKKLLCEKSGCQGAGPWVVTDHHRRAFLVSESKGKPGLTVATVATADALGMCPLSVDAEIVHSSTDTIVVRAAGGSGYGLMLCDPDGSSHECSSAELEEIQKNSDSQNWVRGCRWRPHTQYEVLDRTTLTSTLTVTQYDDMNKGLKDSEQIRISVDDSGITATGPGCSALLPLKASP